MITLCLRRQQVAVTRSAHWLREGVRPAYAGRVCAGDSAAPWPRIDPRLTIGITRARLIPLIRTKENDRVAPSMDVRRGPGCGRHRALHHARAAHLGIVLTGVLGIVGSFVGGFIARLFSKPPPDAPFHPAGIILSVVGALIVLWVWNRLAL